MATDYYCLNESDCSEFMVVPPTGAAFDDPKDFMRE
jgi:hypothetical protein